METLPPAEGDAVRRGVAQLLHEPGPLLNILHRVQEQLGCVPSAAVPIIADALNLSRAEVHGVVTFYHHFRSQPAGRHTVSVCQAEACQSMGATALTAHACRRLGIPLRATTADGAVTLEPVYCLGNCAAAPAIMVDGRLHGRVTAQRFDAVVDSFTAAGTAGDRTE